MIHHFPHKEERINVGKDREERMPYDFVSKCQNVAQIKVTMISNKTTTVKNLKD